MATITITREWGRALAAWLRTDEVFAILNAQAAEDETFCDWLAGGCRLLAECLLEPLRRAFPETRFDLQLIESERIIVHVLIRAQPCEQGALFIDGDGVATKPELHARWMDELHAECRIINYTTESSSLLDAQDIRIPRAKRQQLTGKLHQLNLQTFQPDLPGGEIQRLLREYERVGLLLNGNQAWPCDVGAAVMAYLADRKGLHRALVQGTYEHPDPCSYARTIGEPHLFPQNKGGPIQEAHTWIILQDESGAWLLDPNGELRNEPRCQRWGNERYQPFSCGHELIELPPDLSIAELLTENWDSRLIAAIELIGRP